MRGKANHSFAFPRLILEIDEGSAFNLRGATSGYDSNDYRDIPFGHK